MLELQHHGRPSHAEVTTSPQSLQAAGSRAGSGMKEAAQRRNSTMRKKFLGSVLLWNNAKHLSEDGMVFDRSEDLPYHNSASGAKNFLHCKSGHLHSTPKKSKENKIFSSVLLLKLGKPRPLYWLYSSKS